MHHAKPIALSILAVFLYSATAAAQFQPPPMCCLFGPGNNCGAGCTTCCSPNNNGNGPGGDFLNLTCASPVATACSCTPSTCADVAGGCGQFDDHCGNAITCGCSAGQVCDTSTKACCTPLANPCGTFPNAGYRNCGTASDGCGNLVTCGINAGTCGASGNGLLCGGNGQCCVASGNPDPDIPACPVGPSTPAVPKPMLAGLGVLLAMVGAAFVGKRRGP